MGELPNFKIYKECPNCGMWSFGQYDRYCTHCAAELTDFYGRLAGIADYAKSMLVDFLDGSRGTALNIPLGEIPDNATEGIRANGNILFNKGATLRILAECWNEVESALDDWRERNGFDYPIRNIEELHVFSVRQHAEMIWREITSDFECGELDGEGIAEAVARLKC